MGAPFVLVVDDDETQAYVLCGRLKQAGYEANFALDAIQAASRISARKPDLLVLDFAMPAGSGADVYSRLSMNLDTAGIPVIFLSAMPLDIIQKKVPPTPRVRFHPKPLDFNLLQTQIRELIGRAPPAAGSPPANPGR